MIQFHRAADLSRNLDNPPQRLGIRSSGGLSPALCFPGGS
jgi:hypothetical protein